MALNGASHNVMGIKTGPITGPPPPPSEETASAVLEQASTDPVGNNQGGKDGGDQEAGKKVKSAKELERERKKLEKQQKFLAKKAKSQQNSGTSTPTNSKAKEKKPKQKEEELPEYVEETPAGEKKILKPLDDAFHKAYNPKVVESAWYSWWEKQGFFEPEFGSDGNVKKEGYFVIPEPPPNVTGQLHMGHALPNALQDLLIRWNRMKGLTTVWVPGCDHAGIATQAVIENMLWRREKKTKYDVGREGLVKLIWDWKDEYHHKINAVLKASTSIVHVPMPPDN
ncbi:MAG: hypothetical protein M1834_004623 [Cirrosporium novae-zelandiae]|nr:MAG: hypothetical protein M1834_004623 [Cirrosporium novae-zelandiae]